MISERIKSKNTNLLDVKNSSTPNQGLPGLLTTLRRCSYKNHFVSDGKYNLSFKKFFSYVIDIIDFDRQRKK